MGRCRRYGNAVIVEDQFLLPPTKTDYKFVPLIDGLGDVGITMGGEYTGWGCSMRLWICGAMRIGCIARWGRGQGGTFGHRY